MQSNPSTFGSYPYQLLQTLPINPQMYFSRYNPYYTQFQPIYTPPMYLSEQNYWQTYTPQPNYGNWESEQTGVKLSSMTNMQVVKQEDNVQQQNEINSQLSNSSENMKDNSQKQLQKVETVRHLKKSIASIIQNRRGHWTNEEHYKYLKFVRQHKDLFQTSVQKKLNRVFKMMSLEIQSRTACQCRSHYSKFNPFDMNGKARRKLVNDEHVYERMFTKQSNEDQS